MGNKSARAQGGRPSAGFPPLSSIASPRESTNSQRSAHALSWTAIEDMVRKTVERKDWKGLQRMLQTHTDWITGAALWDASEPPPAKRALMAQVPTYVLETILSIDKAQVHRSDAQGDYVIHYAAQYQASQQTIQMILGLDPEGIHRANDAGYLPLHLACRNGSSVDVIEYLLSSFPAGAETKARMGELPLHLALLGKSPSTVCEKLLLAYPASIRAVFQANLPLHIACKSKASLSVVKVLLDAYPESVTIPGEEESLPVHCAIAHKCAVDVIQLLIQANVDALLIRDKTYRMPLHYAIEVHSPDAVILTIIDTCAQTVRQRGRGTPGDFPLAMAVEHRFSTKVLTAMLVLYPEVLSIKTVYHMYILQSAFQYKIEEEALIAFIYEYPSAASQRDDHGRLPLHYATSRLYSLPLVTALYRAYPPGINTRDEHQQLPLHLLLLRATAQLPKQDGKKYTNLVAVLAALLEAYPQAVHERDEYGYSPLHYAIEKDAPLDIIQRLVAVADKAKLVGGDQSQSPPLLPLHYAIALARSTEVLRVLLQGNPLAAACVNVHAGHQYALHQAILRPLPLPSLLLLFEAFPGVAARPDGRGWLPVHYACTQHTDGRLVERLITEYPDIVHDVLSEDRWRDLGLSAGEGRNRDQSRNRDPEMEQDRSRDEGPNPNRDPTPEESRNRDLRLSSPTGPPSACCREKRLLHVAIACGCTSQVVACIAQPTLPYQPSRPQELQLAHHHLWIHLVAHTQDAYADAVSRLLEPYTQPTVHLLSLFPDPVNVPALEVATPRCRQVLVHRLHYFSRFELHTEAHHVTRDTLLKAATDHAISNLKGQVMLKFVQSFEAFQAEVKARNAFSRGVQGACPAGQAGRGEGEEASPDRYVLPLVSLVNGDEDNAYYVEAARKGFQQYPFLIATRLARRTLGDLLRHEDISLRDERRVCELARQLCEAVAYMHRHDVVHCNLHPHHVFELDGRLVVGDFTHACDLRLEDGVSPSAASAAYPRYRLSCAAPELARALQPRRGPAQARAACKASDCWSLGAVLFQLATGEALLPSSPGGDLGRDPLDLLASWPEAYKRHRLARVPFPRLRNLLDQLLSLDPAQRPTAEDCFSHPVFQSAARRSSGRAVRLPGMPAQYDLFVAYRNPHSPGDQAVRREGGVRVVPDAVHARLLLARLASHPHVAAVTQSLVDVSSLSAAQVDLTGHNLSHSKALAILLSRYGLHSALFSLGGLDPQTTQIPLFLWELRLALELRGRGLLEDGMFVIAIGDSEVLPSPSAKERKGESSGGGGGNNPSSLLPPIARPPPTSPRNNNNSSIIMPRASILPAQRAAPCEDEDEEEEEGGGGDQAECVDERDVDCTYAPFFRHHGQEMVGKLGGCLPAAVSAQPLAALEACLTQYLSRQGLGRPLYLSLGLRQMVDVLLALPTFHVLGRRSEAFAATARDVAAALGPARTPGLASRPTTSGVFARMLAARIPTPELNSRTPTHWLKDREPLHGPPSPLHHLTLSDLLASSSRPPTSHRAASPPPPAMTRVDGCAGFNNNSTLAIGDGAGMENTATTAGGDCAGFGNNISGRGRRLPGLGPVPAPTLSSLEMEGAVRENDIRFIDNAWPGPGLGGRLAASSASLLPAGPFFPELAAMDTSATEAALRFLCEKSEESEARAQNLVVEVALLQEKARLQHLEIRRLRDLVRVTDPRQADLLHDMA